MARFCAKLCRPRMVIGSSWLRYRAARFRGATCIRFARPLHQETLHGNTRRRAEDDQGQRGQVRRPPLHGYPRQGAARHRARARSSTQRQVRVGPCVRRLVDRRLEGHPGLRHAADAGSRDREHRSVHGRDDAAHHVRRDRAVGRQGLRARSALARQARRGVPEVVRAGRHRVLRSRARVLHLRRGRVDRSTCRAATCKIFSSEAAVVDGREVRRRQHGPSPAGEGRLLPGAAGRFAAGHPLGDVPGDGADGRRSRSASPRSRERRASARSAPSSRRW